MEKIFVYDASNNRVEVDLVKYFKYNYTEYFIYTINETDEKGFIKLYVVKVMKELGIIISQNISDESSWDEMEVIVKKIIKEIKKNKIKSFEDLDSSNLNDIRIKKARFFKLDPKLVDMLVTNVSDIVEEDNENVEVSNNEELFSIEIEKFESLYLNIKQEKESLDNVLSDMLKKLTEYRMKYGDLDIPTSINPTNNKAEIIEPKDDKDYEKLYLKTKQEKEALDNVLSNMLIQLTEYRMKYGEL